MDKKYTIEYKYSFFVDLCHAYNTLKSIQWLKKEDLAYTLPSIMKMWRLARSQPAGPKINTERKVLCYWVSSGTWGSYSVPDKIYICPWFIEKAGGMRRVIEHEILHLEHEEETENMSHKEKEIFIETKEGLKK